MKIKTKSEECKQKDKISNFKDIILKMLKVDERRRKTEIRRLDDIKKQKK